MFRILIFLFVLIPAICSADVYNGSSWLDADCNYYNGSSWVSCTGYTYNGSSWVEVDNAGDTTAPTFSSATINDTAATVTLSEDVVITGLDDGDFVFTGSDVGAVDLESCTEASGVISCTAASSFTSDDTTVTAAYGGDTGEVEDVAGNSLATFSGSSVTNNTPAAGSDATVLEVTFEGASESARLKNLVDDASPTTVDGATTSTSPYAGTYSYDTESNSNDLIYSISNFDPTDFVVSFAFKMPTYASSDHIWMVYVDSSNYIKLMTSGTTISANINFGGTLEYVDGTSALNDGDWHTIELVVNGTSATLSFDGEEEATDTISGTWAGTVTQVYWGREYDASSGCDCLLDNLKMTEN
jgi:hypothetical protein